MCRSIDLYRHKSKKIGKDAGESELLHIVGGNVN